jgi:uncharacterized RDD family membrane protein YckC
VRRVVIVCIDFAAAVALSFGLLIGVWYIWLVRYPQSDPPPGALWVVPAVAYLYLTLLKRSRIRTLGYILTGVRIVDIRGGRPSLLQMTVRLAPLLPVPWSLLFDLAWMVDEPQRQTLRDKWAGTFIVRRKAKPVGTAPIRYKRIGFGGVFLIFPEIGPLKSSSTDCADFPDS